MQEWQRDIPTRYFATYEALEEAFRERVSGLVPRYHAGTQVFWKDFHRLYEAPTRPPGDDWEAYITSNPKDCLAFGTPQQVLRAAWLSALRRQAASLDPPERAAELFGLRGHLNQSIRSLSGGETVRLALAKTYLQAACAARLTVASPFSWLARDHWGDFRRLAEHYRSCGTPLELFALTGEDSAGGAASEKARRPEPLPFAWRLRDLILDLGSLLDRLHSRPVRAEVAFREETLNSPCLLCGDNGQGKSLLAKTLAGASTFSGEASLRGPEGRLRGRLLFQDVLNQTLMRTAGQLAAPQSGPDLAITYDAIVGGLRQRNTAAAEGLTFFNDRRRSRLPLTLLEIKVLLAASRLVDPKAALILDEPDWGLSRRDAEAFVGSVVGAAHARGVPVILISHKPWWRWLVRSVRHVCKEAPSAASPDGCLFRIQVRRRPGGRP